MGSGASESKESGGATPASGAGDESDGDDDDEEKTKEFHRKRWTFDGELCSHALDFMVGEAGASST